MIGAVGIRPLMTMVFLFACITGRAADGCEEPDPLLPDVTVVLKRATKAPNGMYVGEFEIENQRISPEISISGRKTRHAFYVEFPDAYIEFKDLNGTWVTLANHLPGTYTTSPDVLRIAVHSKADFSADLFSVDWGNLSGTDFRLILRRVSDPTCIVSRPFRAYPDRASITRIESLHTER